MGMTRTAILAGLFALPGLLWAEPSYQRVTGVAPNDVLNLRAEPAADSADIGDLAHDARAIEVLGYNEDGSWARIGMAEGAAWVSTRFLTEDTIDRLGDSSVPAGLSCGGTEPFWGLSLGADTALYSHPEDGDVAFAPEGIRVAEGRLGSPALITATDQGNRRIEAIVSAAQCSDGMSDRPYGWTLTLQLIRDGDHRFLTGCCHLPRN